MMKAGRRVSETDISKRRGEALPKRSAACGATAICLAVDVKNGCFY
jgi:hypothetical protein